MYSGVPILCPAGELERVASNKQTDVEEYFVTRVLLEKARQLKDFVGQQQQQQRQPQPPQHAQQQPRHLQQQQQQQHQQLVMINSDIMLCGDEDQDLQQAHKSAVALVSKIPKLQQK